jgi:3-oxoadipate enol-lactonase
MPTIENGEVRIHYELSGNEDGELLMFGNSLGSNLRMWDKVIPQLEAKHRILRYDMRGHGASSIPPAPYTLDQLGRDALLLLDYLHIDRLNFCGLSLGGMVAMWLGIHAPQRVNRLILANTAARIGSHEMWDARIAAVTRDGMQALSVLTLDRWFTPQYREQHGNEMIFIRDMIASTDPKGYLACCGVLREADLRSAIPVIQAPCLVITGKHDPATPPSEGRALIAALPHAKYLELDSSHLSAWERADEFAGAVIAFLDKGGRGHG